MAGATETPETVRGGYYGAYLSFFHSCGLTFPILEPVLEILAELGLSFTQVLPNFLRHLIAFSIRVREEILSFGVDEFRHLVMVKWNTQSPGTFLVSPRPGRHFLYREEKWREQFFIFRVILVSLDFLGVGLSVLVSLFFYLSVSLSLWGIGDSISHFSLIVSAPFERFFDVRRDFRSDRSPSERSFGLVFV